MSEVRIERSYTCRRKKDFVTFFAVLLFTSVVAFELYLVLWVPVQLKSQGTLEKDVLKQEMISLADKLRSDINDLKPETNRQKDEINLIKGSLDSIAAYIREYQDSMEKDKIKELNGTLVSFERIVNAWRQGRYFIAEESLEPASYVKGLESKAGIAQGN